MKIKSINSKTLGIGFILCLLMLFPAGLGAGWLITEINQDQFGSYTMQSTFIHYNKVRIETPESIVIVDIDQGEICLIFPVKMLYWKGIPTDLRDGIYESLERQVQVLLQQLPPRERKAMEEEFQEMMDLFGNDTLQSNFYRLIALVETDETDEIAGLNVRRHDVLLDSASFEQVWLTTDVKPYSNTDLEAMLELMQVITKPTIVTAYRNSAEYISLIKGGLVMRSVVPSPFGQSVSEVSSVREANIPDDFFHPPADYRQAGLTEVIQIMLTGFEGAGQQPADRNR